MEVTSAVREEESAGSMESERLPAVAGSTGKAIPLSGAVVPSTVAVRVPVVAATAPVEIAPTLVAPRTSQLLVPEQSSALTAPTVTSGPTVCARRLPDPARVAAQISLQASLFLIPSLQHCTVFGHCSVYPQLQCLSTTYMQSASFDD